MKNADEGIGDLRVADLLTLLEVRRTGSITSAARALNVTASQVSKAVARVEKHTNTTLLSRGARGVALSDTGQRMIPSIESALAHLRRIRADQTRASIELTVAAPSYLLSTCVPTIALADDTMRIRCLELPPALLRAYATEGLFDMAILAESSGRFPPAWAINELGILHNCLFANPNLAKRLGPFPTASEKVRDLPFITPVFNADGRFVAVDDGCPLPRSERIVGHEAQTIGTALELAAAVDQVVFGPFIAAARLVRLGSLVKIPVVGWDVSEQVIVAFNGDRVLARTRKLIVGALGRTLRELQKD